VSDRFSWHPDPELLDPMLERSRDSLAVFGGERGEFAHIALDRDATRFIWWALEDLNL
jgi:hypothetical protein